LQPLFNTFALSDISRHCAYHPSAAEDDEVCADFDVHKRTILANVLSLAQEIASAGQHSLNIGINALPILADDIADIQPRDLLDLISQQITERFVGLKYELGVGIKNEYGSDA